MANLKLNIDGVEVEIESGRTVLDAARKAGVYIPTICAHEDLPNYGACRMCIVEIEGVRGLPTSCTTPATDGMVVRTKTPEVESMRARILELMLSGHPNACLVCPHRTDCEKYRPKPTKAGRTTRCGFCSNRDSCYLRDMTFQLNPQSELQLPTLYSEHNVEKFDPFMDRDYNLCILCGRCWRICEKIHGKPAIMIVNRGRWARPGTSFHHGHVKSGCTFCGACIDICPTGTLSDRYARWYGKPDEEVLSTCALCPEGCEFWVWIKENKCVAARMKDFQKSSRLCAMGRFAYAQLVNSPTRLMRPMVRQGNELIPVPWEEAIERAAEKLGAYKGKAAVIANECELREVKYLYEKLAHAMDAKIGFVPASGSIEDIKPASLKVELQNGIKAVVTAGNYLTDKMLDTIECVVAIDWMESPAMARAEAVLPAAVLSEVNGTFRKKDATIGSVLANSKAPGEARPEWEIISLIGTAMGASGFDYKSARDATPDVGHDNAPHPLDGSPRDTLKDLPTRFRGHYIADAVCALESIGLPMSPLAPAPEGAEGGFLILDKKEIVPNFHMLEVEARQVAEFAKPGQFVILMSNQNSERAPFTLVDWDAEKGSITLVVEEVGRSSREVAALKKGDRIAHVTGPLGTPHPIEKVGTVALGGGCYGLGGIYPIAKALKEAGNRVICVMEASSSYLFYWEDKMKEVCDELIFATKDGSRGIHGGVQEAFVDLAKKEEIKYFVAIGCTFMMRMVSEATRPTNIPTYVALNPIMVDGTGMCGACRVSISGETKFACVDGPIFDGHDVDWDELFSRRGAYAIIEVEALPQGAQFESARDKLGSDSCSGGCGGH